MSQRGSIGQILFVGGAHLSTSCCRRPSAWRCCPHPLGNDATVFRLGGCWEWLLVQVDMLWGCTTAHCLCSSPCRCRSSAWLVCVASATSRNKHLRRRWCWIACDTRHANAGSTYGRARLAYDIVCTDFPEVDDEKLSALRDEFAGTSNGDGEAWAMYTPSFFPLD